MMHMQNTKLPRFRFDWCPDTKNLYVVDLTVPPHQQVGEFMLGDVASPKAAEFVVMCWCGGYIAKERELGVPYKPQHYRMRAETGQLGAVIGGRFNGDAR